MGRLSEQTGEAFVIVVVEVVAVKVLVAEVRRVDEQHGMATGILDQWGEVDIGDPGVA
jgi:hypothetical protein